MKELGKLVMVVPSLIFPDRAHIVIRDGLHWRCDHRQIQGVKRAKKSDWLFLLVNKMKEGDLRELGRIEIVCR